MILYILSVYSQNFRQAVVTRLLRFDDILDVDMLRSSLSTLLEIGEWRKLGGRLRVKQDGTLEIQVPKTFTAQRKAVTFSENITGVSIDEHPLAKLLPHATARPSIQRSPQDFLDLVTRPDTARRLDDFLHSDLPALAVHFTTFTNATIFGLSLPHVVMDAFGLQGLLKAWSLVLSGNVKDVPPSLGLQEDMLRTAAEMEDSDSPRESYRMAPVKVKGFKAFIFDLRQMWDLLWNWTKETRTIFLPSATMDQLRRQALNDLRDETSPSKQEIFLSDGDILTAWIARSIATNQFLSRPITILQATNARLRLSFFKQLTGIFLQNMVFACFILLSAKASRESLGQIAHQNRLQLATQVTGRQVAAHFRELQGPDHRGNPTMLCGPSNAIPLIVTNWARRGFLGRLILRLLSSRQRVRKILREDRGGGQRTIMGRRWRSAEWRRISWLFWGRISMAITGCMEDFIEVSGRECVRR